MSTSLDVIRRRRKSPGAERTVDAAPVDPAHAADADDAGWILFDGHALRDEGMDGAAHVLMVATQKARPLRPGEHAAMETGQGDPLGLTARPAESLECPFASPQVDDGSARRRIELLLPRLHAPNGEEPFARKSTRRKPPKCLWRSETFSTVQGLLDTAASGLPNAPSAFAEGSVNGCGGGRRFVEEAIRVKGYDAAANRWLTETVWRKHDEEPTDKE